jgi:predicted DNA-binding protein with PD1-like motif
MKSNRLSLLLGCALLLVWITGAIGHAQDTSGDFVAREQAVPIGTAPRMKVQLLSDGKEAKEYAVIFGIGDEVLSGLLAFAKTYHVTSAHFTAIGGLNGATLAWFDPTRKMFKRLPIRDQVEVLSMIGDIALSEGKPTVHAHVVVGTSDGTTRGGHLLEAHVFPTLEVMMTVDPIPMQKRLYPETGLRLIDPSMK